MDRRCMRAAEGAIAGSGRLAGVWARVLIVALSCPGVALAQLDFEQPLTPQTHFAPYADGTYRAQLEPFCALQQRPRPPVGRNGPTLSDSIWKAHVDSIRRTTGGCRNSLRSPRGDALTTTSLPS